MTQMLQDRPHIKVNVEKLGSTQIPQRIFERGVHLWENHRVHQNGLYPWKLMVSGSDHENGTMLYSVNVATHDCGCKYFKVTGSTCKHLVAALLTWMNSEARSQVAS